MRESNKQWSLHLFGNTLQISASQSGFWGLQRFPGRIMKCVFFPAVRFSTKSHPTTQVFSDGGVLALMHFCSEVLTKIMDDIPLLWTSHHAPFHHHIIPAMLKLISILFPNRLSCSGSCEARHYFLFYILISKFNNLTIPYNDTVGITGWRNEHWMKRTWFTIILLLVLCESHIGSLLLCGV